MAINKVVYNTKDGEQVLMDLTGDTVTPETLAVGATAHDASGKSIEGILNPQDGKSAYEIWLENGNTGTEQDFLDSLKGEDGYTPVKGVDYFTESDKAEIVQEVISTIGTPLAGTVDENNVITLGGELAEGTYTLRYLNGEEYIEIGTLNISNAPPAPDTTLVWENGTKIDSSTGAETTGQSVYSASNYIEIMDGYTYTFSKADTSTTSSGFSLKVCYYDENKNFISTTPNSVIDNVNGATSVNIPLDVSGAKYFRLRVYFAVNKWDDSFFSLTAEANA